MANLAIKGHPTRGEEVIKTLEMLGGVNKHHRKGNIPSWCYYIGHLAYIYGNNDVLNEYLTFTLEEFLEKFPYEVDDLVLCDVGLLGIITKMECDCEKSDMKYHISFNTPTCNKWYYSKNIKCKFMDEKDKKLAIKGHSTRGKEVIEILKMFGGNDVGYNGVGSSYYYYINDYNNIIGVTGLEDSEKFIVYSLEQFLEKFPYKVGDKVIIEKYYGQIFEMLSARWCNERNIIMYQTSNGWYYSNELKPYKEEIMESKPNLLQQLKEYFDNTPRDVLEKEWNELSYLNEIGPTVDEYLESVKKYRQSNQYPKTYEECCEVLLLKPERATYSVSGLEYKRHLIVNLQRLLICRDAYWKIYGEQMGLGKPWKPDWDDGNEFKYGLYHFRNWIMRDGSCINSTLLAFPTEEMRDDFYDNFKEMIESCKELL